jgi:neutral ceramidase
VTARWAVVVALLVNTACAGAPAEVAPAAPSLPPALTGLPVLRAGLARTDITPPPGPGLGGNGPEGRPAAGYRARLHARALVLQDRRGEAVALVVADLPFTSVLLQRRTAALIRERAPLGADRLLLAATHTHSGPGHFLDAESYNRQGSSVPGFDPRMLEFLARRIADGVIRAWEERAPARVAWGAVAVPGVTRNRSPEAGGGEPDSNLVLLRVDLRHDDSSFRPAGALAIFAMHGTGNSAENDLWDADIQGRAAAQLESHLDSLAGATPGRSGGAVVLLANGAEGDVSPRWPVASRCAPPELRRARFRGSRAERSWEWVGAEPATRARCLEAAREGLRTISAAVARPAASLFDSLVPTLGSEDLLVARAFTAVPLTGPGAPMGLCAEPEPGAATIAGAEDVRTRYREWRFLGIIPSAFEEGPRAVRTARGCQAEKRPALDGILRRLTGVGRGFPEVAQLAVVRLGGLLLASVPAEVTSAAGALLAERVRRAADSVGASAERVVILGLSNGFIQYVTTPAEYRAQHYEGGSTLYGPGTADALGGELARLTRALGSSGSGSPPAEIAAVAIRPGPRRRVLPTARGTPPPPRRILRLACDAAGARIEWEDAAPGELDISAQPLLRIERLESGGASTVVWDDGSIEVRSLGRGKGTAWRWRAEWTGGEPAGNEPGRYRVVLAARPGVEELGAECATDAPASPVRPRRTR